MTRLSTENHFNSRIFNTDSTYYRTDTQHIKKIPKLPESLLKLIEHINSTSIEMTSERLATYVKESDVRETDLMEWSDYSHSTINSYGRNLIIQGEYDNYEILVMSWNPGDFSAIHNHGDGIQWGAVKFFGSAIHNVFKTKGRILECAFQEITSNGQINHIQPDLIHQMGVSPFGDRLLSLHIYGSRYRSINGVTANSRIYDIYYQIFQYTNGGVFFHLPKEQLTQCSEGIGGDSLSMRIHCVTLLIRTLMILRNPPMNLTSKQRTEFIHLAKNLWDELFHTELPVTNETGLINCVWERSYGTFPK